jgi:Tfp pilus assembly protein PilF
MPFTLNDWLAHIDSPYGVSVRGNGDAPLLSYHAEGSQALALLRDLEQVALHAIAVRLQRLTEHPELADDARLQLAIVQLQLDRPDDALHQVRSAFAHHRDSAAGAPEPHEALRWSAEAHYWQGRIHLRPDSYAIAVHEFAAAVRKDPDHARAHRYHAEAIRRLIDTDLERTLQSSLQHYIRLGAPLGVDDELLQPRPPRAAR